MARTVFLEANALDVQLKIFWKENFTQDNSIAVTTLYALSEWGIGW